MLECTADPQFPDDLTSRVQGGPRSERGQAGAEAELLKHGRNCEHRRDAMPVLDLERDSEALSDEEGTVHALGPDLRDHPPGVALHDLGAGATRPGHELGVAEHGLDHLSSRPSSAW